jgi:hypothetical protein
MSAGGWCSEAWKSGQTTRIGRDDELVVRAIAAFIGWAGVALGAFIVSKLLLAFLRRPGLRLGAMVLQASTFIILPASLLTYLYSTPNPFSDSISEQIPGVWLFGVALVAYGLGDWLEQRTNRME